MPTSAGPNIIENGLILALDAADRNSYVTGSSNWVDLSVGVSTGSLNNGVYFETSASGLLGFDGTNDHIRLGNNTLYDLTNLTVSVWIYQSAPNSYNAIINRYGQTSNYNGWTLSYASATNKFSWGGRESIAYFINAESVGTYATNRWHNVVGTKSATTWSIYVNGNFDNATITGSGATAFVTNQMYVGGELGPAYNFYGSSKIGNIQIYNRALSSAEIRQNYNALKGRFSLQ
jgi:hypothetical protein